MKKNLQIISALSLAAVLTACGGGGSSSGGSTATSVSGTASKGIIIGGTVTAYPLVNGVPDTGNALGTATTGANGEYTLELPEDYDGSPILVSVTPASDGSTTMRCDIPSGCGTGVDFGADYDLVAGSGFSMSAILPEATAGQTITVNPTPLTEVAAQLALDAIANAPSATEFVIDDAIADANSATADRFGITGDLNEQPVIDITDPEAVAAATTDAIIYNSLAGAIVEATQDDDGALSIEEALGSFVTDYVDNGGISGNTATDGTTSLEEILTAAQEVLTETGNQEGGETLDLTAVTTELTTETADAGTEPADTPDDGTPSDTAADGELDQVKAMVADIRDIGAATSTTLVNSADAFAAEVELASIATEAGTASAMDALGVAMGAVVRALDAYSLDETLTSYADTETGITVGLATGASVATAVETVTITATVNSTVTTSMTNAVDLAFVLNVSLDDVETGQWAPNWPEPGFSDSGTATTNAAASLTLSLTGNVTNSDVELEITEGSIDVNATIDETETWTQSNIDGVTNVDEAEQLDVTLSFSFDLDVSLSEAVGSEPVSFVGVLGFSVQGVTLDESETFTADQDQTSSTETETWESDITFNTLDISLSGTFAKGAQSFEAAFALSAAGNGVNFHDMGSWTGSWSTTSAWQTSETESSSNTESTNNFVDLGISLSFEATLTGIAVPVSVTFGISRTGLEEGAASLDLAWEGNHLDFDLTGAELGGSATISNQDGVAVTLTENDAGVLSGAITNGGTQYATIDDNGVIHYVDGNFESL